MLCACNGTRAKTFVKSTPNRGGNPEIRLAVKLSARDLLQGSQINYFSTMILSDGFAVPQNFFSLSICPYTKVGKSDFIVLKEQGIMAEFPLCCALQLRIHVDDVT